MHKLILILLATIIFISISCNNVVDSYNPWEGYGDISGMVYTAEDSTALEGVTVRLVGTDSSVTTDTSGYFYFPELYAGLVPLHFTKEHYTALLQTYELMNEQHLEISVYLSRGYAVLAGVVTDKRKDTPVSNVTVTVAAVVDSDKTDSSITDSAGYFLFTCLSPDSSGYIITFAKPGYEKTDSFTTALAGDSVFISCSMERYLTALGTVYESDSVTPVEGVTVTIGSKTALSDNAGYFMISNLLAVDTQNIIVFSKKGYFTQTSSFTISASDTVTLNRCLLNKLTVTGTVFENDSITPIPGVMVSFIDTSVLSSSAGQFTYQYLAPLDTGYLFTFSKAGYDNISVRDTIGKADTVVGPVYMHKICGSLRGTILLQGQTSHYGTAITLGTRVYRDTTDASGNFLITDIPIGTYAASVGKDNFKTVTPSVTIVRDDTTALDTTLIIQSGTIETAVTWTDSITSYIVEDTLKVMASGSLSVKAGVTVTLAENARLLVNGSFTSIGSQKQFALIRSLSTGDGAGEIEVNGGTVADTAMKYTLVLNVRTILKGGPKIGYCVFASFHDPDSGNTMRILSSTNAACLNQCDFYRHETNRGPILLEDAAGSAGTLFSNSIFTLFGDSSTFTNFLQSENKDNGIATQIRNSDFYSEHALPYNFFALINPDSAQVYTVNPLYENESIMDLRLKSTSTLLDKSTTGRRLGAIGTAEVYRKILSVIQ